MSIEHPGILKSPRKSHLQKKALSLVRTIEAILYLTTHMTPDSYKQIVEVKNIIPELSNTKIRRLILKLKQEVQDTRRRYGVSVDDGTLKVFLESLRANTVKGKVLLVPFYILTEMFSKYPNLNFYDFPLHALLAIPLELRTVNDTNIEVYTLETIIFEDMCLLFNQAKKANDELQDTDPTKLQVKRERALTHATLIAVFDFIEAYLNGIATDYYFAQMNKLDSKGKSVLSEGQRSLRFREKLLQFPKIILGIKHPPFLESNCPEIAFLIGQAKKSRDAIVHPTSLPNLKTFEPGERETRFLSLEFEEVEQSVDSAISLVRKIETCIRGETKRVHWLRDKGEDGLFPDSTFD